jgi:hypothetical protein
MKPKSAKTKVEEDAKGQFVRSRHGADNDGVVSAKPRVITGDDDATFDTDPAASDGKTERKTKRTVRRETPD